MQPVGDSGKMVLQACAKMECSGYRVRDLSMALLQREPLGYLGAETIKED